MNTLSDVIITIYLDGNLSPQLINTKATVTTPDGFFKPYIANQKLASDKPSTMAIVAALPSIISELQAQIKP